MLEGIDISNWQTVQDLEREIKDGCDFVIIKVSEGCTFRDGKALEFARLCQEKDIPMFFYHFCIFKTGSAVQEADHFLNCVNSVLSKLPKKEKVGLALDFEIDLKYAKKLGDMADYLHKKTGAAPLIYCSEWMVPSLGRNLDTEVYGLWVAKYSNVFPKIAPWDVMAFWQYSADTIDHNRFYGTREQLLKYQDYSLSLKCPHCTAEKCVEECK